MTWTVGSNRPGFLPEGDPYEVDTWDEAWECLKSELVEWADFDDESHEQMIEGCPDDEYEHGTTLALVKGWLKDEGTYVTRAHKDRPFQVGFNGNDDWPMAFWIERVEA